MEGNIDNFFKRSGIFQILIKNSNISTKKCNFFGCVDHSP